MALRLLVVSPHLDDAVLSASGLIQRNRGAVVATVFAGLPADPERSTRRDRACGFESAGEAIAARKREDLEALGVLSATPRHLGFVDEQYGETPSRAALRAALADLVEDLLPDAVAYPVGIRNADHLRVVEAAPAGEVPTLRYADLPYAADVALEPPDDWIELELGEDRGAKARATACYRSQLDLGERSRRLEERVWRT